MGSIRGVYCFLSLSILVCSWVFFLPPEADKPAYWKRGEAFWFYSVQRIFQKSCHLACTNHKFTQVNG